jgi:hypothetical protein
VKIHPSSFWYGSLLLLLCLLLQPAGIGAQCMIVGTDMGSGTQGGMNYRYGVKYLSMDFQCTVTMQMNMIGCSPDPTNSTDFLSGAAFTTAVDPTCAWDCACGTVTITNVDLPVELMDFAIEDGGDGS